MIKLILCFLSSVLALVCCSSNHDSSLTELQKRHEMLEHSIDIIRGQNDSLYRIVATRMLFEKTRKRASVWMPKVELVESYTIGINNYIMLMPTDRAFDSLTYNTGTIYRRLNSYKAEIVKIDPHFATVGNKSVNHITSMFDSVKLNDRANFNRYLGSLPQMDRIFILRQTLLKILVTQNEILQFCDRNTI
jgi:hypothetical protein